MSSTSYVLSLCQQLQQMGKTPSVALLRQYANKPLTIPEVVKALQIWKSSPKAALEQAAFSPIEKPSEVLSLQERVMNLEQQVLLLTSRLDALQAAQSTIKSGD
ncbi:MAG: hypothetical protein GW763_08860 [Paraglaciecola sp.]|nr:hypothetical protein [Paraglaciecola sp.]NCT48083.1 hypothetical protein [Paraglaciecola sp.]